MKRNFLLLLITVACLLGSAHCNSNNTGVDPCQNHTVLNSNGRQHSIQENRGNCDSQLEEAWYKLEIDGSPAEIPNVCMQNNVCGTQLPLRIDLEGQDMPLVGNSIDAYACTSYTVLGRWDCCVLRQRVRIKNCSGFYVYHLKPTDRCPVAYCAQAIANNPSRAVTRKRGDVVSGPASDPPSDTSEMSTAVYSNLTATTDGAIVQISTEEILDSSSGIITTEQNVTPSTIAEQDVTPSTVAEQDVTPSTVAEQDVTPSTAAAQNATESITTETSVSDVISENSTGTTTSLDGVMSTAVDGNVTISENSTDVATGDELVTLTTELSTIKVNWTTVIPTTGDDAFNQTTKDSRIASTESTANATQNTISNLSCTNWSQFLCEDNITTCYLSPASNQTYIVCADNSGCGLLCDNIPECNDESDEINRKLCPNGPCLEGQERCSDSSGCYTRCDGSITCNTTSAGEDEDNCPMDLTTSRDVEVTSVTVNATDQSEISTSFPNVTPSTDIQSTNFVPTSTTGNINATESAREIVNITETGATNTTGRSDIPSTDSSAAVQNDTIDHTSVVTEHTSDSTEQITVSTTEPSLTSSTIYENVTTSDASVSKNNSFITTASDFSEATDGSVDNVTDTQITSSISTEGTQASSTDVVNITTEASNLSTTQPVTVLTESGSISVTSGTPGDDTSYISPVTTVGISSSSEVNVTQTSTEISQTEVVTEMSFPVSSRKNATNEPTESGISTSSITTASSGHSPSTVTTETTQSITTDFSIEISSRRTNITTKPTESETSLASVTTASSGQDISTVTMEATQKSAARISTDASTRPTITISATAPTESVAASSISTTLSAPIETTSRSTADTSSTDVKLTSTEHATETSTRSDVRKVSEAVSGTSPIDEVTTSSETMNTSAEYASVTGSQPTSSADNQTDHTVVIRKETRGLFYENFGLFVFLVVAGAIIVGICIFGLIGYTYRRRLRTWNPTMSYQDAYGDMEKTSLSYGRDKHGIESPIPDFDILRDEKKIEETSLSQASTLALSSTPGRSEPPFDDTVGEVSPSKLTNGNSTQGTPQQDNEISYITNGKANEGFVADDNVDGIVPVDELDTSPPRALFPWIENAADTKL